MTEKEITEEIIRRLRLTRDHKKDIYFPELRWSAGSPGSRRADAFFISTKPGHLTVTYEIKSERWDFLRDIREADKHQKARQYSNLFYYAAPAGLIKYEEIPEWAGLVEFDLQIIPDKNNQGIHIVKQAPVSARQSPDWDMIAGLAKRMQSPKFRFMVRGYHLVSDNQIMGLMEQIGAQISVNKKLHINVPFMMRSLAIVRGILKCKDL